MAANFDKVIAKASERGDMSRKTIGVDITLSEIATHLFQAFVDVQREKIEESMAKNESKNFKELGKLSLLNELEKAIHK